MVKDEKDLREKMEDSIRRAGVFIEYMSSMNKAGIPDWYVASGGVAAWVELKFAGLLSSAASRGALDHRFTGPQRRFLRDNAQRGCLSLGCIGFTVPSDKPHDFRVALLPWHQLGMEEERRGQVSVDAILGAKTQCLWSSDGPEWFRDQIAQGQLK